MMTDKYLKNILEEFLKKLLKIFLFNFWMNSWRNNMKFFNLLKNYWKNSWTNSFWISKKKWMVGEVDENNSRWTHWDFFVGIFVETSGSIQDHSNSWKNLGEFPWIIAGRIIFEFLKKMGEFLQNYLTNLGQNSWSNFWGSFIWISK